jgi:hypothetical protein
MSLANLPQLTIVDGDRHKHALQLLQSIATQLYGGNYDEPRSARDLELAEEVSKLWFKFAKRNPS